MVDEKKMVLKKHPCPDCSFCQHCSETRCAMCKPSPKKKGAGGKTKKHIPLFRSY